jgi:hypothetical protein
LPGYQLTGLLKNLLVQAETRAVVLDEFHHCLARRQADPWLIDWLIELTKTVGTRLIVAMPAQCKDSVNITERLDRWLVAPIQLPTFDWNNEEQRNQFIEIIDTVFRKVSDSVQFPDLDESLAFMLHRASGGVIGDLLAIVRTAARIAADDARASVEPRDLATSIAQTIGIGREQMNGVNQFVPGRKPPAHNCKADRLVARITGIGSQHRASRCAL